MSETKPVFINPSNHAVVLFDERRRTIRLQPHSKKTSGAGGRYEATGEHYRKFVDLGMVKPLEEPASPQSKSEKAGGKAATNSQGDDPKGPEAGVGSKPKRVAGDATSEGEEGVVEGGSEGEGASEVEEGDAGESAPEGEEGVVEEESEDAPLSSEYDVPSKTELNRMAKPDLVATAHMIGVDPKGTAEKLRKRLIKALHG